MRSLKSWWPSAQLTIVLNKLLFSINEEHLKHWSLRRNRRSFLRIITYYWLLILFINHNNNLLVLEQWKGAFSMTTRWRRPRSSNIILHNIKPPLGNSLVPVEDENKKVPLPLSLLQPWTKTLFLVIISKLLHHHVTSIKSPNQPIVKCMPKKIIFFRVE